MDFVRRAECFKNIDRLILLPIPSTRDKHTILGTNIYIYEVFDILDESSLLVGYGLPCDLTDDARERGLRVCDVEGDETFLVQNAELTALATLGIILNSTTLSPRDMRIGIVGYGRIGRRLARLFLFLGSDVRIYTSRSSMRLELCEFGVPTYMSTAQADLDGIDILINTAPAEIFDTSPGGGFPTGLRVIDLASGNNFPHLETVERYPSIPSKMFPHTAGLEWGKSIERFITGQNSQKGG